MPDISDKPLTRYCCVPSKFGLSIKSHFHLYCYLKLNVFICRLVISKSVGSHELKLKTRG